MVGAFSSDAAFSSNAGRPAPGSWLQTRLARRKRHPDEFDCGVRVEAGSVDGESTRWHYRSSAADPLVTDGVVTLYHGSKITLRLRVDADPLRHGEGSHPDHAILAAVEAASGARLLVSVPPGELVRFGVDLL